MNFSKFKTAFVIIIISATLNAQVMVVSAPAVEASVSALTVQTLQIAMEEKIREYNYYLEYIAKFTQFISAVNGTTATIRNAVRLGKVLKERTYKDWLDDAETAFYNAVPEFSKLKDEIMDLHGQGEAAAKGKYFDYVSKWDHHSLDFFTKLADNYQKHVMFPELFPLSSKAYGWDKRPGVAVVHKAWMEAGMDEELGDDAIRRKTFGKYYKEYEMQAKENENLEALGLSKIMQINMMQSEDINHVRKNSDLRVMESQFATDMQKAHSEMRSKRQIEENEKNAPTEEEGIFDLKRE